MKKVLPLILCALLMILSVSALAEDGVTVTANDASITGYTVDFAYTDADATNVRLLGGFQFYVKGEYHVFSKGVLLAKGETMNDYLIEAADWQPNSQLVHAGDTGATIEMAKGDDGVWTASLDLPGGSYLYQISVSYDNGETWTTTPDPANLPECNVAFGSRQNRSKFYVPYDEKQGEEDYYDWSWLTPVEDEAQRGEIIAFNYEGLDVEQVGQIYLPAGYDAEREEPYKVLYMSHGGGGDEADWFHQGNATNIVDRLIADGVCEPFVMVTMYNEVYREGRSTDSDEYHLYSYQNIKDYLIPYVEANYNIRTDREGKAFLGLSNGAKLTTEILVNDPEAFSYYGIFSGSAAWAWPELEDYSVYQSANIYLAAGYADQLFMGVSYHNATADKTLIGLKEKLEAAGVTYNNGGDYVIVEGTHDWFTWPQVLKDYVTTTLWK